MCGIAGFYSKSESFSRTDLEKMTRRLHHRGPDAQGFFFNGKAGLGHTRLSIIDLSEKANQPMFSHDKRFVISYNGEIYNYKEIANEIKRNETNVSFQFNSSSDTEVIVEAFAKWGANFVNKLNGMFSIAIYDTQENELYLFLDRIGIKPLYYYWDGNSLVFASELKALKEIGKIPLEINKRAVRDFLQYNFIPTPDTIYKNIKKLEAGTFLKISSRGIESQKYWDISSKLSNEVITDENRAIVQLNDLLKSSVSYQLQSDVPIGVFLSGGIDSSLVAALASQQSSLKINTFSIGFEENKFDESQYAKKIARHLGTNHHEFIVSSKDATALVDDIIGSYDIPFGDSSAIPTMLLSKLTRSHVTVALSGDGGDELFHGYGAYLWAQRLKPWPVHRTRQLISKILSNSGNNRYKRAATLFNYKSKDKLKSHIFSQEQYCFSENELNEYLQPEYVFPSQLEESDILVPYTESDENLKLPKRILSPAEQQALFDIKYYLKDDLLTKIDIASMKYSLETRVPYLDHRVIEFSLNLSPVLKNKNGIQKYILKEILYQYVPKEYFQRPKQGFAIPLKTWLKEDLKYLIDEYLSEEIINRYGIIKYSVVNELKQKYYSSQDFLYNKLWLLIMLHKWFKEKSGL